MIGFNDLKPGMIFIAETRDFSGRRQLHVYRIVTAPSANTSFTVEILNVSERKLSTNYWKSREWEAIAPYFRVPSVAKQKAIIKAVFEIKEVE